MPLKVPSVLQGFAGWVTGHFHHTFGTSSGVTDRENFGWCYQVSGQPGQTELLVGGLWWLSSFGVTAQTLPSFSVSTEGEFLPRVSIPDENLDIPLLDSLQPSVSDTVTSDLRGKSWHSYFSANMEEIHLEFRF